VWLAAVYGRFHLVEVLGRASEISRGTGEGRALAVLARLVLSVSFVGLLVRGARWVWAPSIVVGGAVCLWAWPSDLSGGQRLFLVVCAIVGAALLMPAARRCWRSISTDRSDEDATLMALWALSVAATVWGVHNFAAPRYLLGAMLPLAILMVLEVGERRTGRTVLWVGAGIQLLVAAVVTTAEHRFFEASADIARATIVQFQPTHFTGEWAYRHEMDSAGVEFFTDRAPSGSIIAAPIHSSPGALPNGLIELGRVSADESIGIRLVSEATQVGMYAETLGILPIGWSSDPLEEVVVWRVP